MAATAAAAWQDPAAAWDTAEVTVPSTELEVAVEAPVSSAAPSNYEGDVVKCIAFYPYTVNIFSIIIHFGPYLFNVN